MTAQSTDFKYNVGDKVLFKTWSGGIKKGRIIGRRQDPLGKYYAIKTLFTKDEVNAFNIYGLIGHEGE